MKGCQAKNVTEAAQYLCCSHFYSLLYYHLKPTVTSGTRKFFHSNWAGKHGNLTDACNHRQEAETVDHILLTCIKCTHVRQEIVILLWKIGQAEDNMKSILEYGESVQGRKWFIFQGWLERRDGFKRDTLVPLTSTKQWWRIKPTGGSNATSGMQAAFRPEEEDGKPSYGFCFNQYPASLVQLMELMEPLRHMENVFSE